MQMKRKGGRERRIEKEDGELVRRERGKYPVRFVPEYTSLLSPFLSSPLVCFQFSLCLCPLLLSFIQELSSSLWFSVPQCFPLSPPLSLPLRPHISPPAFFSPFSPGFLIPLLSPLSSFSRSSPSFHLNLSSFVPPLSVRLCVPCHSPCCPRLRHMALSSLLLSSINTLVSGNYRHIAQHARLCCSFWCWRQNKVGKDVRCLKRARKGILYTAFRTLAQSRSDLKNSWRRISFTSFSCV